MGIYDLLKKLTTKESEIKAIVIAVESGLTHDPKHIEKAIRYYERLGSLKKASQLAENLVGIERAIKVYEKECEFFDAIRLAEKTNDSDLITRLCKKGIKYYKPFESHSAGLLYEKMGNPNKAFRYYEISRSFRNVAELAEKVGDVERAFYFKKMQELKDREES